MIYDTSILLKYGNFEPDIIDGKGANTAIESISKCRQLRWSNYSPFGQHQRLSALISIYEIPKIQLDSSELYYIISIENFKYN